MTRTLLIVRHGIAEDRIEFQKRSDRPDSERPLTRQGQEKMQLISKWLNAQLNEPVDYIIDSPLLRSQQTADILSQNIKNLNRHRLKELDPKVHPEKLMQALDKLNWKCVIIVGHEDHLSRTLAYILGVDSDFDCPFKFKKGGVAHLTVHGDATECNVTLNWQVTPKIVLS